MITVASKEMTFELLHDKLGLQWSSDFRGVMFVHDQHRGKPQKKEHVGVAYGWHGFIGRSCFINILVQDPVCLTRAVVREAFRYPFEVANCNVVLAAVDSTNLESMAMCRRVGFKFKTRIERGGLEGDLTIWSMAREECRWLKKEH